MSEIEVAGIAGEIAALNDSATIGYSSIKSDSFEDRKRVANAISASEPLREHLNRELAVKDVVIQAIQLADERTGEVQTAPRVILITEDGTAYHAISTGLLRSIKDIFNVVGEPHTWDGVLGIKVHEKQSGVNRYFTIEVL